MDGRASSGEDWFELWNPNPQPVAIGGYFLTDDLTARTKSPSPRSRSLAEHQWLSAFLGGPTVQAQALITPISS